MRLGAFEQVTLSPTARNTIWTQLLSFVPETWLTNFKDLCTERGRYLGHATLKIY